MGGPGSGNRWNHWGGRATVEDYHAIDVRRWAREGYLKPGNRFAWQWTCNGEKVACIRIDAETDHVRLIYRTKLHNGEWEDRNYPVRLDSTPCHLGGTRRWFRCPTQRCGRRVAKLYGGAVFACRNCHQLAYPSQREAVSDRFARRAERIRSRLEWEPGILNGNGSKPKGMHWQTFHRLERQHDRFTEASINAMLSNLSGIACLVELQEWLRIDNK